MFTLFTNQQQIFLFLFNDQMIVKYKLHISILGLKPIEIVWGFRSLGAYTFD